MAITKSYKKASLLIGVLIIVGVSSAYFSGSFTGQSSESETLIVEQTLVDSEVAEVDSDEYSGDEIAKETTAELTIEKDPILAKEESTIEENTSSKISPIVTKEVINEEFKKVAVVAEVAEEDQVTLPEATKKLEVKQSEQLIAPTSQPMAEQKVKKVENNVTHLDPFNLIISSEVDDSNIFEKYDFGVYVNAFNESNGKIVEGDLQVYDNVRSKKISTIKTHEMAGVNDPKNRNHSIRIISSVFGYRPQELSFSLNDPSNYSSETASSAIALSDSVIRVNLHLERLKAGDIAVMWKVYFFKDAAIMQSRSKPELQDLFNLMNENPTMKIALHGHTNGNSHGKVIHLGELDNGDFFNINSDKHVETTGSAQKLSLYRAETIQNYLISKGIDKSRVNIKGWGGKKMLHDKHSTKANLNVRVEVEVLEI